MFACAIICSARTVAFSRKICYNRYKQSACCQVGCIYMKGDLTMAHFISDECISCGACEGECPVSCISAGDSKYVIDPEQCIDCGACAAVCPVEAIAPAE